MGWTREKLGKDISPCPGCGGEDPDIEWEKFCEAHPPGATPLHSFGLRPKEHVSDAVGKSYKNLPGPFVYTVSGQGADLRYVVCGSMPEALSLYQAEMGVDSERLTVQLLAQPIVKREVGVDVDT